MNVPRKPLGHKNYGSIPHLPGSRLGPGDHSCHPGQARIATEERRDKHDEIFVQEKLDGSNVGVARIDGQVYALGRAGYLAQTSPYEQHQLFASWVRENADRFMGVLQDGERLVGEWLAQAHGTRYDLPHEPLVVFDLMVEHERLPYEQFLDRTADFEVPLLLDRGYPCSVEDALLLLDEFKEYHGAIDPPEGIVWRVERDRLVDRHSGKRERVVDFLVKWVRPDKVDGAYLPEISGKPPVWNWRPQ